MVVNIGPYYRWDYYNCVALNTIWLQMSILYYGFLLRCQKTILIITNAIPIGRKNPILPLTTLNVLNIMKINPLIAKNIAAVLYDFEFLDDLLFTMKVHIIC